MKTQSKLGGIALSLLILVGTLPVAAPMTGCNTSTVAALVTTLGNASASIAALEGDSALAATLQKDTAAAAAAVANWKQGTPAQDVVQALQLVQADLSLFPLTSVYAPLIDLALGTVVSIIEIVDPNAVPVTANVAGHQVRIVHLANPPKNAKQFSAQWNTDAKLIPGAPVI